MEQQMATFTDSTSQHLEIRTSVATSLGIDPGRLPALLNERQVAAVLGLRPATLSVWRCTGRYDLRFIKSGRLVRYRLDDIIAFILTRSFHHTGEMG